MKKEIADKWVEALRSGKYTQGTSYLKTVIPEVTRHCCLGVLCEVLGFESETYGPDGRENDGPIHSFEGDAGVLPKRAMEMAGMSTPNGIFGEGRLALSDLNDSGTGFTELAAIIETNWADL